MIALLETLNRWGGHALDFASGMFGQSALLIGVLGLADTLLYRRARAALRYALWSLILVKLLLPPSLALPTGAGYWLRPAPAAPPAAAPPSPVSVVALADPAPLPSPATPASPPRVGLTREGGLLLFWMSGSVAWLVLLLRRSRQVALLAGRADPASPELETLLDESRRQLRLRRPVRLGLSSEAFSPAVWGLRRPVVMLPRRLAVALPEAQLRAVLLHELIHVKRGDAWVNSLQALLQVVYWWHPLVWFANARIRRVREEAVDEAVMVALGSRAEDYPSTLLEVAKLALAGPRTALGLMGIFESRGALHRRIRRLLDRPAPRSAKLGGVGWVSVAVCAALLLPMAHGNRAGTLPPPEADAAASGPPQNVLLDCRVLEITAGTWASIPLGSPSIVGADGHQVWVWAEPGFAALSAALSDRPGVTLLSRPRLITTSGVTGSISVTRATNLDSQTLQLGAICELTPDIRGTEIDLAVQAAVMDLRKPEGEEAPESGTMTRTAAYVRREVAHARATVPDRGTLVVHNPSVTTSAGTHLLFLARPVILREDPAQEPAQASASAGNASSRSPGAAAEASPALVQRLFKVDPEAFAEHLKSIPDSPQDASAPEGASASDRGALGDPLHPLAPPRVDPPNDPEGRVGLAALTVTNRGRIDGPALSGFLRQAGVSPNPPTAIYWKDRQGILMARATPEDLDRIERALAAIPGSAGAGTDRPATEPATGATSGTLLETRVFKLNPNTVLENLNALWAVGPTNVQQALRDYLAATGVATNPPNSVFFNDRTGVLFIRASGRELDTAEQALDLFNRSPPQIQIEAKFMEAPEGTVASRSRGTVVSAAGATNEAWILSDGQTRDFLAEAEKVGGVDILAAPRVTTLSGRQAQVQVNELRTILTGIDPQVLAEPGREAGEVTNASPFLSQQIPLGPAIDLIASVLDDGCTLELTARATVTEFLGYERATNAVAVFLDGERQVVEPPQPRLRTRRVTDRARVYDGQTLLLVGPSTVLTNRFADSVPVLGDLPLVGRLFRTQGVATQRRQLIVLLTPTIIDPAGNRVHAPDNLPFNPESVPPQPE